MKKDIQALFIPDKIRMAIVTDMNVRKLLEIKYCQINII